MRSTNSTESRSVVSEWPHRHADARRIHQQIDAAEDAEHMIRCALNCIIVRNIRDHRNDPMAEQDSSRPNAPNSKAPRATSATVAPASASAAA